MPGKKQQNKPSRKKLLWFSLFVVLNIAIVLYIALREFSGDKNRVRDLTGVRISPAFLLLAVACFGVAILMETLKYRAMIIASEGKDDPRGAYECAVLGKYYDNITPLGAGGQPFQIVYLKKRGLSSGSSAALPIAGFLALQMAFVLVAAVVFIFNSSVTQEVSAIRITAYIGLLFYLFIPVCVLRFSFSPKPFAKMICWGAKFLCKLHLLHDYDRAVNSILSSLGEYSDSLKLLRGRPFLSTKLMFYSVVYQLAIMSIPYFVLHAFGSKDSWWAIFSMVVFIYAAITMIPTPGNSGAAEGSFYIVFSTLSNSYLFWAMLSWRLLVYYGWLVLGLLIVTMSAMPSRKQRSRPPMPSGPLRVALFCDIFYPSIDGVVRTVDAYAKRLNRNGGYCCVVCPRSKTPYQDNKPYDVFRTPAISVPGLSYLCPLPMFSRSLKKAFRSRRFDVLHVHSPFFVGRFALWLGRIKNIPVVATFHSKYCDDVLNITHSRVLARIMANYVVTFYSKADVVWACSASTAETLKSYGFRGEIQVMENGVEPYEAADPKALAARARKAFSLPDNRRILLFVGQQIWQKNLRLVLDVTKRLQSRGESYLTVIAGKGYDSEAICRYADSLGIDKSVKFVGCVTDRDLLHGLYLASDLFFFPSLYDNAPLVLREAAQMGLPALLAAGSNSAEVVQDGVNGYTAENDCEKMTAKILSIFAAGDRAVVGERARQTIPVSWDDIVAEAERRYHTAQKHRFEPVNVRESQLEVEEGGLKK